MTRTHDDEREPTYPLAWPVGWRRTPDGERGAGQFGTMGESGRRPVSFFVAQTRLFDELDRLGAEDGVVISTNVRSHDRAEQVRDPGVAVYFTLDGARSVLACDKWIRVADNTAAIAAHIDAIRGQQRWGVGTTAQAFAGYRALPAIRNWWEILGVSPTASAAAIKAAKRTLLEKHHPDKGGDAGQAAEITAAYADAVKAGAVG